MRSVRTTWLTSVMLVAVLACSDDSTSSSVDASETNEGASGTGDGDGDGDSGDGDGDSGNGDGDSGDGDGDGDGDSGDGDGDSGDGDGDSGDGDGDGDGDSGDGDGDSGDGCDPNAFIGEGISESPWSEGSFCDEIYVCADAATAAALMNLLDDVQCEPGCDELHCTIASGGDASAQDVADACTALSLPGIDAVYCIVLGP